MIRILYIITGFIIVVICLSMAYTAERAESTGGAWLPAAFALLFCVSVLLMRLHLTRKKEAGTTGGIVPHWRLLVIIGTILLIIMIAMARTLLQN